MDGITEPLFMLPLCLWRTVASCNPLCRDRQTCKTQLSLQRPRKRLTELLAKTALDPPTDKQSEAWGQNPTKTWTLKLLRSPTEFLTDDGERVSGLKCAVNRLKGEGISVDQVGFWIHVSFIFFQ